jgi:signal transduction histidine kinase
MSACTFVSSSLEDASAMSSVEGRQSAQEDVQIVDISLHFINDLLRNMLDLHRATSGQMELKESPTSVLDDILRPVTNMLYTRGPSVKVILDCPPNLFIMADRLRLVQIVLNLGRNALKFVTKGFIRFRATTEEDTQLVRIYIEDSGPGVPEEKRKHLFHKFQESLDALNQGTG